MAIISTVLLLAYGAHVALLVWRSQNLGVTELAYLIPMCFYLAVVWIWQSRHIPNSGSHRHWRCCHSRSTGGELDELIEQRRLDDEIEARREFAEQQKNDQDEQRFLNGIEEWQARQRWMQEGR
jgi:hypothetical protein